MALNWNKLKALVHYVCQKAEDPSVLGSIKLNKVLWYSDVIHYMATGRPITGETYVKRQHGPVPKHVLRVLEELVREHKVARGRVDHFGYLKTEYIAITKVDANIFSGQEVEIIEDAFKHIENTARSISEETHGVIWQLAEMGEEIPYHSVFASVVGEVDEDDIAWAQQRLGVDVRQAA